MLCGSKVRLVPIEKRHLDATRRWANDPALQQVMLRYGPVTEADQDAWHEDVRTNDGKVVFAVESADDVHVGNVGLYHIDGVHRRAEFWIAIGERSARGSGMGEEALRLVLGFAFQSLNLNRVYLNVSADNSAALALYRKVGFAVEGTQRQHCYVAGRYLDIVSMAILREEWHAEE